MIQALIIDDENCIESLAFDLQKYCPDVEVMETCISPKQGLLSIKKYKPDLVFLDVQMPWMNGFEMLEMLDQINFAIIFTTAYDQFAAKAFRLSAIDYLLKPVDANDLKEAVRRASEKIQQKTGSAHIKNPKPVSALHSPAEKVLNLLKLIESFMHWQKDPIHMFILMIKEKLSYQKH
jgi:two-component system LytT family response regulator